MQTGNSISAKEISNREIPGYTGIGFYASDVNQTVSELKKKGVKFSTDYKKTDWGGEIAKFDDPDGNIFWLSNGSP